MLTILDNYVPKADLTKVEKKLATLQGRQKRQKETHAEEVRVSRSGIASIEK